MLVPTSLPALPLSRGVRENVPQKIALAGNCARLERGPEEIYYGHLLHADFSIFFPSSLASLLVPSSFYIDGHHRDLNVSATLYRFRDRRREPKGKGTERKKEGKKLENMNCTHNRVIFPHVSASRSVFIWNYRAFFEDRIPPVVCASGTRDHARVIRGRSSKYL